MREQQKNILVGALSAIEESKSIELQSAFEIETFVLHSISAVGNYQRRTATKRAAHKSVVEFVISFWWSRASRVELTGHIDAGDTGRLRRTSGGRQTPRRIFRVSFLRNESSVRQLTFWEKGAADNAAEVCEMVDRPFLQILEGGRHDAGYLCWYFRNCKEVCAAV